MKKLLSTLTLAAVLTIGASQAHAGIVVGSLTEQQTQSENQKTGIVVGSFTGIVVGSFIGIVVGSFTGIVVGS